MKTPISHNDAFWSVITQLVTVLILSVLITGIKDLKIGASFAIGGMICVLPNIYLYRRVFAYFGARAAKRIVTAFYLGEAVKLILTGGGFALAFMIPWMRPVWLFLGYIAAQAGFWLAPLVLGIVRSKKFKNEK